jgi:hypothetical protein
MKNEEYMIDRKKREREDVENSGRMGNARFCLFEEN